MQNVPCPWRMVEDTGAAFLLGCLGGTMWHAFRGIRNSPKGTRMSGMISAVKSRAPILGGSFAIWGLMYSGFDCTFSAIRRKEDPINSILAGGLSGGCLAIRGGIKAFGTNFAIGSVMLALIEGFNMYLTNRVMKIAEMQQEQLFGKSVLQLTPPYTNFRENITTHNEEKFFDSHIGGPDNFERY